MNVPTRREQLFSLVTDAGITAEEAAAQVGIGQGKARTLYAELVIAGRVYRGKNGYGPSRFFLTAGAAQEFAASGREALILNSVSDKGWTGNTLGPVVDMDKSTVRNALQRLASTGKIHAGTNARGITRYFKTKEAAEAFALEKPPSAMPSVEIKTSLEKFVRGAHVIRPDHVKVQKLPGFKGLGFAEKSKARVEGGFADLGPGRYLEEIAG